MLAGLPGFRAQYDGGLEDELNIRTRCPTHRAVLAGGTDDVLNDLQHRSVAAEMAAFPEALRDDLTLAVAAKTSDW